MRVLLTGGTGFFGSHVAEALRAAGHEVRALVRPGADTGLLRSLETELVPGELCEPRSLAAACPGVEAVVHVAGLIRAVRRRDLYAVNAEGTRALAEAAAQAGAARFVLVSTLAAAGPGAGPEPGAGGTPRSHYGRSKRAGEEAVLSFADRMAVAVLRPPILYGPRGREVLALFRMAARGVVMVPRLGDHRVSLLYAPEAAGAVASLLLAPAGRVYAAADGVPHTWPEIAEAIAAAVGREPRIVEVPRTLLATTAALSTAAAWILRRAPRMPWDGYRDLRERWWVGGHAELTRATAWKPIVPLAEGLRRTAAWYRAAGWLT